MSLKIALFASGRGSNVQAILKAIETGTLDVSPQCLIANMEDAPVLDLGRAANLPTYCIPHKNLSREQHEADVLKALASHNIDYIVLAGYMRMLTPGFLKNYAAVDHYRIVNIHPSMLPAFPGTHAYEDAFNQGVKTSGVTVHFVDEIMDNGPILIQESFPRHDDDTLETFKARGLALEHRLYPQALQYLAENRVSFRYDADIDRCFVELKTHAPC